MAYAHHIIEIARCQRCRKKRWPLYQVSAYECELRASKGICKPVCVDQANYKPRRITDPICSNCLKKHYPGYLKTHKLVRQ